MSSVLQDPINGSENSLDCQRLYQESTLPQIASAVWPALALITS